MNYTKLRFLSFLACLIIFAPQARGNDGETLALNNEGVKALNRGMVLAAIEKFQQALKVSPDYATAKENLACAYNNYGLQLQANPKAALHQFHKALAVSENDGTARSNLDASMRNAGMDPRSFSDRVALGNEYAAEHDSASAEVAYREALKIKDDPLVRAKLNKCTDIGQSNPSKNDIDFGPYMSDVQRHIKAAWSPPRGAEERKCVVLFQISRDGQIAGLKLERSSGSELADTAAMKAVENAAPFRSLPVGAPGKVDIQFHFDYKSLKTCIR